MADQTQASPFTSDFSQSTDWTSFWHNQLASGTKPVSGNALQSGTQALDSMGSPNLESSAGSGFASTNQGPTGGGFNASASIPTTSSTAAQTAADTASQSNVGNTTQQNTASTNSILSSNNALLNPKGTGSTATNQSSNSTGLPSGLFGQATQALGLNGIKASNWGQSVQSGINNFGADYLGTGLGDTANPLGLSVGNTFSANDLATIGNDFAAGTSEGTAASLNPELANAGSLTGSSLSSLLGGAGLGFGVGSLYGSLAGLSGSKATNAELGGLAGGAIGAATSVTSGLALGATLGSVVPGLGTAIGAVAGSILGGLFGSSQGTAADTYYSTVGDNTGYGTSKNGASVAGVGQQITSSFANLTNAAGSALGINFNPNTGLVGTISTKHPGPEGDAALIVNYNGNNAGDGKSTGYLFFNPGDAASVSSAYYKALSATATQAGYTDSQALYDWYYGTGNSTPTTGNSTPMVAPLGSNSTNSIGTTGYSTNTSNVNIAPRV